MYSLTQGTIITGVRSDKYSNIRCNGVVISARCDLANCKISKIYYLIAVPSDDWLLSDEGFNIVLSQRQNDLEDKLQTKLGGSGLDWSTLKSFSVEEFSTVIHDQEVGLKKDTDKVLEVFRTFKNYTSKYLELGDKKAILQNESKSVASSLLKIANGQMMHYIYVPENAYIKDLVYKSKEEQTAQLKSIIKFHALAMHSRWKRKKTKSLFFQFSWNTKICSEYHLFMISMILLFKH